MAEKNIRCALMMLLRIVDSEFFIEKKSYVGVNGIFPSLALAPYSYNRQMCISFNIVNYETL
ncbi:hypothetical protein COI69_17790 [Bacillus cereus]|uniref:Uncharacterized protein n=1 Tax=Bacillus cereus TaxID=1396 RepID=A0A9X7E598_BACCE|nr:hypothetical protein COE70_29835 [Bacillus cereus]PHG81331.1 hypothetical protein COI69_17790 [Bacillus cereus]